MGGEISVDSVYTKGSTFLVMLEQNIVNDKELGTFTLASRMRSRGGEQYKQSFEAPDAHILVVDDNEMNLKVACGLLQPLQMQIDTAESGKKAIELVQSKQYHIVFMDHMMPVMDGVETTQKIRALDDNLLH